jgi:predicted Rossmann fold nucleotide-binding protein DprA/Smf involved in DNA uptake
MPTHSELIYWLTLINQSGLKLNLVKPIIQQWCFTEQRPLAELFDLSPLEWSSRFGLADTEAEQASRAREKLSKQAAIVAQWQSQQIEPLIRTDPRYPKRLIHALPAVKQPLILWACGAINLLNEPGVAVLGSQPPEAATTKIIDEVIRTLLAERVGLVSGYGRGLDRITFEAMLTLENGWAVTVLPMGLAAFAKSTTKLESAIAANQIVLVSPFAPDIPYQDKLAEARNLLIDHLALALLIPQADDDSLIRAKEALGRDLPVFVGLTDTAANRTLLDSGALLLTDAGEVVETVQQALIDDELLDDTAESVIPQPVFPTAAPPAAILPPESSDSYALHADEVEPLDSDEALDILSLGGNVPDILRERLEKAKKAKK